MSYIIPVIISMLSFTQGTLPSGEGLEAYHGPLSSTRFPPSGQELFLEHADHSLVIMAEAAKEMSVQGVAAVAFIPKDTNSSWISKMKVAGALTNGSANFLAVAYSKAAEMADTHRNSGSRESEPMHGEFGYQGGVIEEVTAGYILAVFSGATGEQDTEIASKGLAVLKKGFAQ